MIRNNNGNDFDNGINNSKHGCISNIIDGNGKNSNNASAINNNL